MANKVRKPQQAEQREAQRQPSRVAMHAEIDRVRRRLDAEIRKAQKRMDDLLATWRRAA